MRSNSMTSMGKSHKRCAATKTCWLNRSKTTGDHPPIVQDGEPTTEIETNEKVGFLRPMWIAYKTFPGLMMPRVVDCYHPHFIEFQRVPTYTGATTFWLWLSTLHMSISTCKAQQKSDPAIPHSQQTYIRKLPTTRNGVK